MQQKAGTHAPEISSRYGPVLSLVESSKEGDALILDAPSAVSVVDRRLPPQTDAKQVAAFSLAATFVSILAFKYLGLSWGWGLVVGPCAMTLGIVHAMLRERSSLLSFSVAASGSAVLFGFAFGNYRDVVYAEAPFFFAAVGTFFLWSFCYIAGASGSGAGARRGAVVALYADRLEYVGGELGDPQPASLRLDPTDEVRTIDKDGIRNVFLMARDGSMRFRMSDYVAMDRDLNVVAEDVAEEIRSRISRL